MKEFKCEWDTTVWAITIGIFLMGVVFLTFGILFTIFVSKPALSLPMLAGGFLPWVIIAGAAAYAPRGYRFAGDALHVVRFGPDVVIPFAEIREYSPGTPGVLSGTIRLFGCGGLFGYMGLFQNKALGRFKAYMTRTDQTAIVRTNDGTTYVLSPTDVGGFLQALGERTSLTEAPVVAPAETDQRRAKVWQYALIAFLAANAIVVLAIVCWASIYLAGMEADNSDDAAVSRVSEQQVGGESVSQEPAEYSPEQVRSMPIAKLFALVESPDPEYKSFAPMSALQERWDMGDAADREAIEKQALKVLADPDGGANWQYCYLLSHTADPEFIPVLAGLLQSGEETMRGVAACALGQYGAQENATRALKNALETEQSEAVREWIRKAIDGGVARPA